jgi:hypothetical protein
LNMDSLRLRKVSTPTLPYELGIGYMKALS